MKAKTVSWNENKGEKWGKNYRIAYAYIVKGDFVHSLIYTSLVTCLGGRKSFSRKSLSFAEYVLHSNLLLVKIKKSNDASRTIYGFYKLFHFLRMIFKLLNNVLLDLN